MPSFNLKAKFALVAGTMILVVAAIITMFLTRQQEHTIREELVHRAVALTQNLAYNCQLPLAAENKPSLRRLADGLLEEGEVSYVEFLHPNGAELLQAGSVPPQSLKVVRVRDVRQHPGGAQTEWLHTDDGRTFLDVHTTVSVQGSDEGDILSTGRRSSNASLGHVRLGLTAAAAERRIADMRLLAGLLGVLIAAAGSLLAAGLIHIMTRPLGQLMEGNARVARGDFSLRLAVRSHDEFGQLASSYNQMADEIERARVLAESYLQTLRQNSENLEDANRALKHTNAELAKASRMKSEFLATMSHELRTPLNVIIGFSEVLLDQTYGALNPKQERYSSNIQTSGRHLLALINDILDLSKVEAGKMQVVPGPFDLRQSLEEIQSLVRPLAAKKGIQMCSAPVPQATLVTDQKLFKQVMFNLLSNAIKFTTAEGRVDLEVRTLDGAALRADPVCRTLAAERRQAIPGQPLLLVEVRDTGVGIGPENYDKIFVAFQQLDGSYARKQEGTGLGLALTRKIVQLLGGEIWFSSRSGEGTRFWFYVPTEYTESDAEREERALAPPYDWSARVVGGASGAGGPAAPSAPDPTTDAPGRIAAQADWPWGGSPRPRERGRGSKAKTKSAAAKPKTEQVIALWGSASTREKT
jgi:signal transduction histidine kinase